LKKLLNSRVQYNAQRYEIRERNAHETIAGIRLQAEDQIKHVPKMLMLSMLIPVALTIALCLLAILMTWIYLPAELFSAKTETINLSGGKTATVIISNDWTMCTLENNQQKPCKIKINEINQEAQNDRARAAIARITAQINERFRAARAAFVAAIERSNESIKRCDAVIVKS